ncbi:MAG: YwiC-like family protein [Anaerolineaceae bacterium]|nr:YwiC-like family protein [Anaerolineaceae bacterium]
MMAVDASEKKKSLRLWQRHIAVPIEHGSWVFLFSPLLIGLAAGRRLGAGSLLLALAVLAGFMLLQPLTVAVKVYAGRRTKDELEPARFWILTYGVVAGCAAAALALLGYGFVFWLVLPALPVLAWRLWLVSRREERRKSAMEIAASGVLALTAPAAYWVGQGEVTPTGWLIWGLCWLQAAGSILYAYLRLEQRSLKELPAMPQRLALGKRALLFNTFNLALVLVLAANHVTPALLPAAFGVQWVETLWGLVNPALNVKPVYIGVRQLIVSTLFTLLFIITWVSS